MSTNKNPYSFNPGMNMIQVQETYISCLEWADMHCSTMYGRRSRSKNASYRNAIDTLMLKGYSRHDAKAILWQADDVYKLRKADREYGEDNEEEDAA